MPWWLQNAPPVPSAAGRSAFCIKMAAPPDPRLGPVVPPVTAACGLSAPRRSPSDRAATPCGHAYSAPYRTGTLRPTAMNAPSTQPARPVWAARWQRFSAASVRSFHTYANWLVGITWKRFVVLSVLLLIVSGLLQNIPPFSWSFTRTITHPEQDWEPPAPPALPVPPAPPSPNDSSKPSVRIERPGPNGNVEIVIDERGVRITPRNRPAAGATSGASAPAEAASAASAAAGAEADTDAGADAGDQGPVVDIRLPPGVTSEVIRQAVEEARKSIEEAVQEARTETEQAAQEARTEAEREVRQSRRQQRVHEVISLGEFLPSLALLWIVASAIIKITYKRQIQAEAQAAQAVETAESESLKRQVVEARMAAMQAQVEPHFLFNTLASIDHLIEVDPKRASQMQKNLIALLRASMPTMREANGGANGQTRDLGRELAVIRPYLEILKVRMEERLSTEIDVPEGLLSAEFPPMMVQTLVENAIKHGLEPKPEGGKLTLKAEVVHGKLTVTVADTGLGFGRAATAGTGVGLANIRERLQLLYGPKATLTIAENPGGGTRVTLAVPYKPLEGATA